MLTACLHVAMALLTVAPVLNLYRLFRGPDTADRILALDTLHINAAAMLVLYGIILGTARYYEAALLITVFVSITTPVSAHLLAKAQLHRRQHAIARELPGRPQQD